VQERIKNFRKLSKILARACISLVLSAISIAASGDQETDILTAFEIWLKNKTGKNITLQRDIYDVDLQKLVCMEAIQFSVPGLSKTMVRAECPNHWRRFIKAPENSIETPNIIDTLDEALAAAVDIQKGDSVTETILSSVEIGRGAPRNLVTKLPTDRTVYAQRTIPKGSLLLRSDISTAVQTYKAKTSLMPMQSIQANLFETVYLKTDIPEDALLAIDNLQHFSLAVQMKEGDILRQRYLRKRKLVSRGDIVSVDYVTEYFSITTRVIALEDGYIGDTVRVRNEESGRRLMARVTGPNKLSFEN